MKQSFWFNAYFNTVLFHNFIHGFKLFDEIQRVRQTIATSCLMQKENKKKEETRVSRLFFGSEGRVGWNCQVSMDGEEQGEEGSHKNREGWGHARVLTPSRTPMASSFVAKMSFTCCAPPGVMVSGARSALRLGFFLAMCLVAEVAAFLAALRTTRPAIVCVGGN
jgi:hypothetical protein